MVCNIELMNLNAFALETIANMLKANNIGYLSYGLQRKSEKVKAFFTHQDWADRYFSENLFELDPLVDAAKVVTNSVIPWEMVPINHSDQKIIMTERFECCSLKSGITFSKSSDSSFEIVAVGFSHEDSLKIDETRRIVSRILQPVTYMLNS